MMEKVTFTSYGISAPGYSPVLMGVAEHTFVTASKKDSVTDNWNCWGRGKETINNGARKISEGFGVAEWARMIYGTDPTHPTGLLEKVDGVCQNASNRVLALAGVDVSDAQANLYTILLYGKFGLNLGEFIKSVNDTAAILNDKSPGAITETELQEVIGRIAKDPSDELAELEEHFQSSLPKSITADQNTQMLSAYRDFQTKRQAVFEADSKFRNDSDYQNKYAMHLAPLFLKCMNDFTSILGAESRQAIFGGLVPEQALPYLLKMN
jgi:hypothetical protein